MATLRCHLLHYKNGVTRFKINITQLCDTFKKILNLLAKQIYEGIFTFTLQKQFKEYALSKAHFKNFHKLLFTFVYTKVKS